MFTVDSREGVTPSRVVVVGAGGFVGRVLAGQLAADGIEVVGLARSDIDLTAPGAADALAVRLRPDDAVVMLAAITPDRGRGLPAFMTNMRMAETVLQAAAAVPPAHMVYLSSDAVYPMQDEPVGEATPVQTTDLYGMMHLAREALFRAAGPAVAVLRPTLIYGVADTHNSYGPNRLRRQAFADGRIVLFGGGEETRDHITVEDVARLIGLTIRHRGRGVLNLATGRSVSYDALARMVAARFDPPVPVEHTPRQNPVTHRSFDIGLLRSSFPSFAFEELDSGIARAHRDTIAAG